MDKIEAIREKIGECDDIIIEQLAVRMSYIQEIISYKKATGIPILQPEQEKKQTDALKSKLFLNKEGKQAKGAADAKVTVEYTNNPSWLMVKALPAISNPDHISSTNSHDFRFFSYQLVFLYTNRLNGSARRTFQLAQFCSSLDLRSEPECSLEGLRPLSVLQRTV